MPESNKILLAEFVKTYPSDAARVLEQCDEQAIGNLVSELSPNLAAAMLSEMDVTIASRCLELLDTAGSSRIISAMAFDSTDPVMRRIDAKKRAAILASMPPELKAAYETRLRYPPSSAGGLMDPFAPVLPEDITVKEALRRLRRLPEGLIYHVFVLTRDKRLIGFVTLRQLTTANPQDPIQTVTQRVAGSLLPEVDRAIILTHPAWRVHPVLPVATQEGLFLGTISYRTLKLLEEAEDKHQEKGSDAGTALGELYWLGLMALVRGAISSIKGKED